MASTSFFAPALVQARCETVPLQPRFARHGHGCPVPRRAPSDCVFASRVHLARPPDCSGPSPTQAALAPRCIPPAPREMPPPLGSKALCSTDRNPLGEKFRRALSTNPQTVEFRRRTLFSAPAADQVAGFREEADPKSAGEWFVQF